MLKQLKKLIINHRKKIKYFNINKNNYSIQNGDTLYLKIIK